MDFKKLILIAATYTLIDLGVTVSLMKVVFFLNEEINKLFTLLILVLFIHKTQFFFEKKLEDFFPNLQSEERKNWYMPKVCNMISIFTKGLRVIKIFLLVTFSLSNYYFPKTLFTTIVEISIYVLYLLICFITITTIETTNQKNK